MESAVWSPGHSLTTELSFRTLGPCLPSKTALGLWCTPYIIQAKPGAKRMAIHKVAGEDDAFCTRCKLSLAHIIVAMIRSKSARAPCNTFGGGLAARHATDDHAPRRPTATT